MVPEIHIRIDRTTKGARVRQVIETLSLRGRGIDGDELREVRRYWDFDGTFLAEYDPIVPMDVPPVPDRG
jgi:hypothetical protein